MATILSSPNFHESYLELFRRAHDTQNVDQVAAKFFALKDAVTNEPTNQTLCLSEDLCKPETFSGKLMEVGDVKSFAEKLITRLSDTKKATKAQEDLLILAGYVGALVQLMVTLRSRCIQAPVYQMLNNAREVLKSFIDQIKRSPRFSFPKYVHFITKAMEHWFKVEGKDPSPTKLAKMREEMMKLFVAS